MLEVDLPDRNSVQIELRCNMRIELNRKVPQTNPLSLGVLDMDEVLQILIGCQSVLNLKLIKNK